jgi:hypothetical protein
MARFFQCRAPKRRRRKWQTSEGLKNVCIHKGLFPPSVEEKFPHLVAYSDVRDVAKAAQDWPQLNFIIYHSAYRWAGGGKPEDAWAQFQKTGRIEWVSDLAEIPAKYGGTNAKLYNYSPQQRSALENDRFAQIKGTYEKYGEGRSNLRYGYVAKPLA